jgi:broad specificity phosphatase PhoE
MKLIIVRHGETYENAAKIVQGHLNSQLNELGQEQAKKVALRLKNEKIDFCYSSDLSRCVDTAEEIVNYHSGLGIVVSQELREQAKGKFTGKTREERNAAQKEMGIPYYAWDFDGGETLFQVSERVVNFMESLLDKHEDKTVLVVTHGGPITTYLLHLQNIPIESDEYISIKNTSITEINYQNETFELTTINCDQHLK